MSAMNVADAKAFSILSKSDGAALRQRALEAYASGDVAQAQRYFELALDANPLDPDTLADLGALAVQSGNVDDAMRWNRRALALEPTHDAARYAIASAMRMGNQNDEAMRVLRSLLDDQDFHRRAPDLALAARSDLDVLLGRPSIDRGVLVIDPRALLLGQRLDIIVKYLYARQRLGLVSGGDGVDAERHYTQHIHLRTGGQEPGDEGRKGSMQEFQGQFDALIDSMAAKGFDPDYPVPLSSEDGLPLNGAHRIATALAVGCDIAITSAPMPGGLWDMEWFRQHGYMREDRNLLLRTLASIKPEHFCVTLLWSPVEAQWPEMERRINAQMPVVNSRTVELPREAFEELVHDIYSLDWGPRTGANIERKVDLLAGHPPRVRIVFCERPFDSDATLPRAMKTELREAFAAFSPVDHFTTLHVSESAHETCHLMNIFASENNLRRLQRRRRLRPGFLDMLVEMNEETRRKGIDPADCCVVGSSVLDALGLREADDIDFTLRSDLRFRHFDGGVTHLTERLDVVSFNYPRSFSSSPALTDDDLIARKECQFHVRGMRFADPGIVLTRKQHQRREKDLRDVALLSAFFDAESLGAACGGN